MSPDPSQLTEAFRLFGAANAGDPTLEPDETGMLVPRELFYARRMRGFFFQTDGFTR